MRTAYDDSTLTGDGFVLRAPTLGDVDDIVAACVDEETQRWLPLPHPYTADHARHFVEQTAPQQLESGTGLVRAVDVGGRLHGVIDLKATSFRNGLTEIGYWVAPWGRGHGLAGRAARVLSAWALTEQDLHRVTIHAATGNLPSQRSALAAGFVREGVLRSAGFTHSGRVDLVVLGRIRDDLARDRR